MTDITFSAVNYSELKIPNDSIVYCDPPYKDTTDGYGQGKFNHNNFYNWLRKIQRAGALIYVPEYSMPEDFVPVWKREINCTLNQTQATTRTERLYKLAVV